MEGNLLQNSKTNNQLKKDDESSVSTHQTSTSITNKPLEDVVWNLKSFGMDTKAECAVRFPDLSNFMSSMTLDQNHRLKIAEKDQLDTISRSLEGKTSVSLNQMNNKGIFHPSVNLQRAHSQYVANLHSSINLKSVQHSSMRKLIREEMLDNVHKEEEVVDALTSMSSSHKSKLQEEEERKLKRIQVKI